MKSTSILRTLLLSCFLTAFAFMASEEVKAQCGPNDFFIHNYTTCDYDWNLQYTFAPGTCNYAGNLAGTVPAGGVQCITLPAGAHGYAIRVYGNPYGPVDATVGLPCVAPGTVQPVSDCNIPGNTNTVSYTSWMNGGIKIY
ncbi:hypothetical protein KFE98_07765 [bacterium SCSIO 12741]|nr:hypothetical protein KFE98_07765 [bacterium SCSIO 12741]